MTILYGILVFVLGVLIGWKMQVWVYSKMVESGWCVFRGKKTPWRGTPKAFLEIYEKVRKDLE